MCPTTWHILLAGVVDATEVAVQDADGLARVHVLSVRAQQQWKQFPQLQHKIEDLPLLLALRLTL